MFLRPLFQLRVESEVVKSLVILCIMKNLRSLYIMWRDDCTSIGITVKIQGVTLFHTPHNQSTMVDEMKSCISAEATLLGLIVPYELRR